MFVDFSRSHKNILLEFSSEKSVDSNSRVVCRKKESFFLLNFIVPIGILQAFQLKFCYNKSISLRLLIALAILPKSPVLIYSWSISNILEHKFFCFDLVVFSTFHGQKKSDFLFRYFSVRTKKLYDIYFMKEIYFFRFVFVSK